MLFSVIIPVYNVEPYLDGCIQSVLSQTYTDFELILVDDGSTDRCPAICDRWSQQDPRIRVIHKRNGGLSSARNVGTAQATGQYIVYLDSDDHWLSTDVLRSFAYRIAQTAPDILVFNLRKEYSDHICAPYFPEDLTLPEDLSSQDSSRAIAEHGLWSACAWNKVILRDLFADGGLLFREGITSEDIDWCLRLALKAERFDYLGLCVVGYRQRSNSITGSIVPEKVRLLLNNVLECLRLLEADPRPERDWLKAYIGYQYGTLLFNIASLPSSHDKRALTKDAKDLRHLLTWSDNAKLRSIRSVYRITGFYGMLSILRIGTALLKFRNKRSS